MRGRRRGRNRPSPPDSLDVGNEPASSPGTGSVTLIGPESEVGSPPSPAPTPPISGGNARRPVHSTLDHHRVLPGHPTSAAADQGDHLRYRHCSCGVGQRPTPDSFCADHSPAGGATSRFPTRTSQRHPGRTGDARRRRSASPPERSPNLLRGTSGPASNPPIRSSRPAPRCRGRSRSKPRQRCLPLPGRPSRLPHRPRSRNRPLKRRKSRSRRLRLPRATHSPACWPWPTRRAGSARPPRR